MKSKLKVLLAAMALTAMTGSAMAAAPGAGFGGNPGCPGGIDRLNLSPEQVAKLGELREKHWKETIPLRNEMQVKRLELRTLWTAPNPDKNQILAKQKEMNEVRDKIQAEATAFRLDIRKALTPEQAAQLGTWGPGQGFHRGLMGGSRMGWQSPCGGSGQGPGPRGGFGFRGGFGPCQNRF